MITLENINWKKVNNLIPVIIQDSNTIQVLMLGYMNNEALQKTIDEKVVTFFSRTKQKLWTKGETSGNTLEVIDISLDCDNDTILILAKPNGPTCHTGEVSCFDMDKSASPDYIFHLNSLFSLLEKRKETLPQKSYSTKLFRDEKLIHKKLREEIEEVIEAGNTDNKKHITEEACDVLFHLTALLVQKNINLDDIEKELYFRNTPKYTHKNDEVNRG